MRLFIIIPTAALCSTHLAALAADHTAQSREARVYPNLRRRIRRQHIIHDDKASAGKNKTRGLDIYDDSGGRNNRNHYTRRPTRRPTRGPTRRPTRGPTRRPTRRPATITSPSASQSSFRLKLYWKEGYYWQGNNHDPVYCMGTYTVVSNAQV